MPYSKINQDVSTKKIRQQMQIRRHSGGFLFSALSAALLSVKIFEPELETIMCYITSMTPLKNTYISFVKIIFIYNYNTRRDVMKIYRH